ncbi:hypothetical protein PCANC_03099 [Puccinia coronata f. sp. avenae]|uniref:Zn(2)-C6 fungal-type domain-containing protein n=1 Tax=Puccinia coronata f. sp. avenae TaxID=200324 RepID=A0A2N5W4G4_9BASI|nr:hypothetical protein PCANC_03099 [Puccinia coronata f. sp. avenae]
MSSPRDCATDTSSGATSNPPSSAKTTKNVPSHDSGVQLLPAKPKRKLNRRLASCSGCRKRRTRCDRGSPCSECFKRKLSCDYSGAVAPSGHHPSIFWQVEREEYIKKLETRLQALENSASLNATTSPSTSVDTSTENITVDDLAAQLSIITIGQRVRHQSGANGQPHPIRTQLESILAFQSNSPPVTFIGPDDQFSLNLLARYPLPSLQELCSEHLPSRSQINFLSEFFFSNNNLLSTALSRIHWEIQLDAFWSSTDRVNFRPSPCPDNPPHLTRHYLAQFVSIIYAVIAHGLMALADIHHLQAPTEGSTKSDHPNDFHPCKRNQAEKISLAKRWYRFSLDLLISPEGNIYVKPTVFGIKAMAILGKVEHAPENFDHVLFFWSLTCNLAMSAGLLREPPITDDEDIENLDEFEIESRRGLAWSILALEWAGCVVDGGFKTCCSLDQIAVELPGTVVSAATSFHPIDGWPLDPFVCIARVGAQMDRLLRTKTCKNITGQFINYKDVIETQREIDEIESSIPQRLQGRISADGKSFESVVKSDATHTLLGAFLSSRICMPRIRLLRLFLFPNPGVPPEERVKQLEMLLRVSKVHFLALPHLPHGMCMHPLMIYGLINTAVACALLLVINHQTHDLVIDEDFFLCQLQKVIALFDLGKETFAATMTRRAITLLQALIRQSELHSRAAGFTSRDRRKKGPGAAVQVNQHSCHVEDGNESMKRKQQSQTLLKPDEPEPSQRSPYEFGMLYQEFSHEVQHNQHESRHAANESVGIPTSFMPSTTGMIPIGTTSPMFGMGLARFSAVDQAFTTGHASPPSVPSHPLQPSSFLVHSSSTTTHLSSSHPYSVRSQYRFDSRSASLLPLANMPRSDHDGRSRVEFGRAGNQLDHYQFDFPFLKPFSEIHNGGDIPNLSENFDSAFLSPPYPSLTSNQEPSPLSQSASNLSDSQAFFNHCVGLTVADDASNPAGLASQAHPVHVFSSATNTHYEPLSEYYPPHFVSHQQQQTGSYTNTNLTDHSCQ